MSDFKNLNLDREKLEDNIKDFINSCGHVIDGELQSNSKKIRVVFGPPGETFATVDFFLNKDGSTTIQWKLGKNQPIGQSLAEYLKNTINPAEFQSVNYSLQGITSESFDPILECIEESDAIVVELMKDDEACKQVKLVSKKYDDQLTLTHHRKTRVLQIQGKPLSCYRRVIFMITDLLDLKGLEQVLYRKDESCAEVVRKEMAEEYIKLDFPDVYEHLPTAVKKLLISSCCVKLASPQLPDYCLLLYPDLRALEGVLKHQMSGFGMYVSQAENGFGDFFYIKEGFCYLRGEYSEQLDDDRLEDALNSAYTFYRKHRHTLFHMEDFVEGSRMVDTLDKAISISKEAYAKINQLYSHNL